MCDANNAMVPDALARPALSPSRRGQHEVAVTFQLAVGGSPVSDALQEACSRGGRGERGPARTRWCCGCRSTGRQPATCSTSTTARSSRTRRSSVIATAAGQATQCIFDGYVLSWRLHLDRGSTASTLRVWAQDASWLMNIDDDGAGVAGAHRRRGRQRIFASYGFTPAEANTDDDSPAHQPASTPCSSGHRPAVPARPGPAQRQDLPGRLRGQARRPHRRISSRPAVGGPPAATISLVDPVAWNVDTLDLDWDVMRPTEVDASQVVLTDPGGSGPGTRPRAGSTRSTPGTCRPIAGRSSTMRLTATADVPELPQRTAAVLPKPGGSPAARAKADLDRLGTVLRAGTWSTIEGAGRRTRATGSSGG